MVKILFITVFLFNLDALTQETTPANIEQVFDAYFKEIIKLNPELASQLGITKKMGVMIANAELTDVSERAIEHEARVLQKYQSLLKSYDPLTLTASQRLARDILLWHLDNFLGSEMFRHHWYLINPKFGVHNGLTTLMTEYHTIESYQDANDYISRLAKYNTKFDQLIEGLTIRRQEGIIPPKYIIETMIKVMSDFISVDAKNNVLYTSSIDRLFKVNSIETLIKLELYKQVEEKIKTVVYPSYEKFIAYMKEIQQVATEDAGVWKLPDGDEYYQYCLNYHTTTNMTPQEIHKLGIKEVKRIQKESIKTMRSLGIKAQPTYVATLNQYWNKTYREKGDDLSYPRSQRGKKQALEDYHHIIDDVKDKLPSYFSLIPKTTVIVKPVPEFKAITIGAYYSPASLDGKREGIFYVNLNSLPFKPDMKTLTYHEAVPGHHFQIALQQESSENRLFRNLMHFTAYVEGWALYAEKLGMENGWFVDPHEKLSYLNSELFRAVRLVVDTCIHYKRWTRDQAYNYMVENLGWGSYPEIDRYIVWPGQACAYKIGELKILELRKLAKKKLGKKFDIKEFHRAILEHGSMPLEILEKVIFEYIQSKQD